MFGYRAAAYTTLVSYILLYYFHRLMAQKFKINEYYDFKKITQLNIMTLIIGIFLLLILRFSIISFIVRYIFIIIIIVIVLSQKELVLEVLKKGKKDEKIF